MKGMTNALPVLIDASTLATKSDISDMETKTNANATFATKTALTALQNATKVAVENFAITESADKVTITTTAIDGATSKSEDIPAVTDTMAGIMSADWFKKLKTLYNNNTYSITLTNVYYEQSDGYMQITKDGQTITINPNESHTFTDNLVSNTITFNYILSKEVSPLIYNCNIISTSPSSAKAVATRIDGNSGILTITNSTNENVVVEFNVDEEE